MKKLILLILCVTATATVSAQSTFLNLSETNRSEFTLKKHKSQGSILNPEIKADPECGEDGGYLLWTNFTGQLGDGPVNQFNSMCTCSPAGTIVCLAL